MASHKSALKRQRRDARSRLRNRRHRSRFRSQVKKMRKTLGAGDPDAVRSLLPATLSLIDHMARLGMIHPNAAARTKSRIQRALNRLAAGPRA